MTVDDAATDVQSAVSGLRRVAIAKDGVVFWTSRWVSPSRAERIRRKNQRLIDANRWEHHVTIEEKLLIQPAAEDL